ncbi:hypothetical protein KY342_02290 [Candidatus Woesearchaeota archaeon]|nr:hypothetical protein [Candidatus Woesearchaeota archaeon]
MKEKTELKFISIFTATFLAIFIISALIMKNYEFLIYTIIASILISIMVFYYQKFYLTPHILLGLIILGLLHIAGLYLHLNGTRLYDIYLINNIFRYDNLVHSFGIFVITFIGYNLLKPHLGKHIKYNKFLLSLILILIAMGIGTFNELLELGAVIFFNAAEKIGDYLNNALDLFFNLIGSIIACFFIIHYHKKTYK